jgi:hypothetical protein
MRILKAMYGEKQAPKLWSDKLHLILTKLGFVRCPFSACLYRYHYDGVTALLCVHVDDGLLLVSELGIYPKFISSMETHLPKVTLTQPLQKYVGIEMSYDRETQHVRCSQTVFARELETEGDTAESVPMCPSYNLRIELPNPVNESLLHITGKLRYLCDRTRWDLLQATGEISKGGANEPSDAHKRTAHKTLRYAKQTAERALILGSKKRPCLFAFCDASYHSDGNSKSRLGGCLFLSRDAGAFHSFSKSSTLVTQSSTHAELLALYDTVNIVYHCRQILQYLGIDQTSPTMIFIDSQPSIDLCSLLKMTHKTSSVNMRVNYIRQCLNSHSISLHFVPTALNCADVLTKPLAADAFNAHSDKLQTGFKDSELEAYIQQAHLTVFELADTVTPSCQCCFDMSTLFSTLPHAAVGGVL